MVIFDKEMNFGPMAVLNIIGTTDEVYKDKPANFKVTLDSEGMLSSIVRHSDEDRSKGHPVFSNIVQSQLENGILENGRYKGHETIYIHLR